MLRKPVESLDEALANIAGAIDKAADAGKFMAAVWMVKEGRIELVHRETWDFPTGDFDAALTHLRNNLEGEKKLLEKEKKPEPLPLGTPFLERLRGTGKANPPLGTFDGMVKPPSLLGTDPNHEERERKEEKLEDMGLEKVPEAGEEPSSRWPEFTKIVGDETKEEPDEKDPESDPRVEGGEGRGKEGVEGCEDGPPVQA